MNKTKIFTLLIGLLLTSQVWAAAWDQSMPLQNSEQQAEAFLKIRALIPSMSEGAARYSFNPVQLLENQTKIEGLMAEDATYAELKSAHRDLVSFTIFAASQGASDSSKLENWYKWVESSTATAHKLGLQTPASVVRKIQELLISPWLGKSQGLVVGLAQLLPNEIKKDFFAMPLDAKVAVLEKHLPAEVVSHGFAPARLGWNETEISKAEIINRLKSSVQVEQAFTALIVYHYSLIQGELSAPKDYLTKWGLEGPAKKTLEQAFNSQVSKLIPTEQKAADVSLVMREISPLVGIFRGFAGNDCSTYCSFPFVNSPNEFTFLVYDSKGAVKGYVQGTKVLVRGQAAFYLHTIVGPRTSREDTFNIMRALNQEKANMGWSEILLPSLERLGELVNSVAVREAMKEVISSEKVPMEYQDAGIRKTLKSTFNIQKDYDDADKNKEGNRLLTAKLGISIQISRGLPLGLEKVDGRIDKNELIGMLLQLGKDLDANRAMISALVSHAGLSANGVEILIRKSKNYSSYPTQHFITDFSEEVAKHGFTFKEGYFQKNISLLAVGLLKSPDLLKDRKLLAATLESLYEQHDIKHAEDFLELNKGLYADKKISDAFLRAYYNDVHEADLRESASLRFVLNVRAQNVLGDPELLSYIMTSENAKRTIVEFLQEMPAMSRGLENSAQGRKLLALRDEEKRKFNIVLAELLKADSERMFTKILDARVGEVFKLGMLARIDVQRRLMAAGLTHYLSLNPKETLYISRPLFDKVGYEREMRRLMPYLMKENAWSTINGNIHSILKLPNGERQLEASIPAIMVGIRQRTDITDANVESYPGLKKIKPFMNLRCERLF